MTKNTMKELLSIEKEFSKQIERFIKDRPNNRKDIVEGIIIGMSFCTNKIRKILANNIKII
jgi:tRNA U38,U39,U40 pseudouridine synthase TruA